MPRSPAVVAEVAVAAAEADTAATPHRLKLAQQRQRALFVAATVGCGSAQMRRPSRLLLQLRAPSAALALMCPLARQQTLLPALACLPV